MAKVITNGVALNVMLLPSRRRRAARRSQTPNVFIHGLAASQAFWYASGAEFFSMFGPSLLYDLKGHGRSEIAESGYGVADLADDFFGLLDHYEAPPAHVIAHSFGGMIAIYAALKAPERFKSLTLLDVRVRPLQQTISIKTEALTPRIRSKLEKHGIDPDSLRSSEDGITYLNDVARIQIAAPDDADDILRALHRHPRIFKSPKSARRWIELTERASVMAGLLEKPPFQAKDLSSLRMPMNIQVGMKSPTLNSARKLHTLCPHAVYQEHEGMGHFFPINNQRTFLRSTLKFIRQVNNGKIPSLPAETRQGAF